ncbi:hypothetical protein GOODEAATRI_000381, partial [Goodea atripinnis]
PQSAEQVHFNTVSSNARDGVWMCRGAKCLYHPRKMCKIIKACAVLRNLVLGHGIHSPPGLPPSQNDDPDPQRPLGEKEFQHRA